MNITVHTPCGKDERNSTADLHGPAVLCISASTTTFDCDCDGFDIIGNVAIAPEDIVKAVAKSIDPTLWDAVKDGFDWKVFSEDIDDFALEVGSVSGYSWTMSPRHFADTGDSGYKATLSLSSALLSTAVDMLLYTFALTVLDKLVGGSDYIERGSSPKESVLADAKDDPRVQARLKELGLDFSVIEGLFGLEDGDVAQDIFSALWALDGREFSE